MGEDIACR